MHGVSEILAKSRIIGNGATPEDRMARKLCLEALDSALQAVVPSRSLERIMKMRRGTLCVGKHVVTLASFQRISILSVGKASVPMLQTAMRILPLENVSAILITPRGLRTTLKSCRITKFESGHPIPDERGLKAGKFVESSVKSLKNTDLLICLISGGASALLVDPPESVPLKDKATLTTQLLRADANIHEINTVRRHLSKLKGGRLVELCPASILSFILSDVAGNSLSDIGSGLTAADPTTYGDAVRILKNHNLWRKVPKSIITHLKKGVDNKISETPKPNNPIFSRVHNFIIAENRIACEAAKKTLDKHHVRCEILTSSAEMNVKRMAALLASMAQAETGYVRRERAIIIGGETTLEVRGRGMGGRNQETVLSIVESIAGLKGTAIAAMGTDGIDGRSPAAGAIVDGNTLQRASNLSLSPQKYLQNSDSYHFFKALRDNIVTDKTGTNVGDIYMVVRV